MPTDFHVILSKNPSDVTSLWQTVYIIFQYSCTGCLREGIVNTQTFSGQLTQDCTSLALLAEGPVGEYAFIFF